ncbi:MAG: NAD-dependent epimerase/dehydratase family protein, partial [Betaproteobacteria bacterium]|nr:NAD-dependent epimerase/dehydratase family protein [Betaproteobacteria bacterium]
MRVLVTGAAGFIGFHVAKHLLGRGDQVLGVDSVNDYYDPSIKRARLSMLQALPRFSFMEGNLADESFTRKAFEAPQDRVIHLAAQAGVRYSLVNPMAYVESNIMAFTRVLEACRHNELAHLTYASTSSVYGANTKMPFSEHQGVDHPLQFYAASKRANELMAHSYSH